MECLRVGYLLVRYLLIGCLRVEDGAAVHPDPDGRTRRASQRRKVTAVQTHPRPGQQPHERGVGGGVVQHLQGRDDVGDLRQAQQTAEPDDLHRHSLGQQGRVQRGYVGTCTHQHSALPRPGPPGVDDLPQRRRDPTDLARPGRMQRHHRRTVLGNVRPGTQLCDAVAGPQRRRDRVRQAQQPAAAALVDRQLVHPRRLTVTTAEVQRESVEVRHRRPPPTVDRLAGVTDGGHRMAAAEQAGEHPPLRHGGVLIFVQEHNPGPGALQRADLGHAVRQPDGERDQIAEVDDVQLLLGLPVLRHDGGELPAGAGDQSHPAEGLDMALVPNGAPSDDDRRFDLRQPVQVETGEGVRVDEVLAQLRLK